MPFLFPYDWSIPAGPLTKFHSYLQNLEDLFPEHQKTIRQLEKISLKLKKLNNKKAIKEKIQLIQTHLEPLLISCKEDENLFLFLLKHQEQIDLLMYPHYLHDFLARIHPEGLEVVGEKLCDQYHRRGFFSQISECKLLLTQILHARSFTPTCL